MNQVASQPPGWYPDPAGAPWWRWWDGNSWSDAYAPFSVKREPSPPSINYAAWLVGISLVLQPLGMVVRMAFPQGEIVVPISIALTIAAPIAAMVASVVGVRAWLAARKQPGTEPSVGVIVVTVFALTAAVMTVGYLPVYPFVFP
ncbi:MAG: DUF2510 domain-containing protein [Candidatus Nanopelagicales bacterium]